MQGAADPSSLPTLPHSPPPSPLSLSLKVSVSPLPGSALSFHITLCSRTLKSPSLRGSTRSCLLLPVLCSSLELFHFFSIIRDLSKTPSLLNIMLSHLIPCGFAQTSPLALPSFYASVLGNFLLQEVFLNLSELGCNKTTSEKQLCHRNDISLRLLGATPGIVLRALHALTHLIPTTTL